VPARAVGEYSFEHGHGGARGPWHPAGVILRILHVDYEMCLIEIRKIGVEQANVTGAGGK